MASLMKRKENLMRVMKRASQILKEGKEDFLRDCSVENSIYAQKMTTNFIQVHRLIT